MLKIFSFCYGNIKRLKIKAKIIENNVKFQSLTTGNSWQNHDNLQVYLSSLAACQYHTLKTIITQSESIKVKSMNFITIQSGYDLANYFKGGPSNILQEIRYSVQTETNTTQQQLDQLRKKVEESCPIYQMITRSGVTIKSSWKNVYIDM